MTESHPLLHTVLSNIVDADNSPTSAMETISSNLGIGQRYYQSEKPTTLTQVIIQRIHDGDWVYSLSINFLQKDSVNAIQSALKAFMCDPRVALDCVYDVNKNGEQVVRVPMHVWIGENAPRAAKDFAETGVIVDLILTRPDENILELTHIEVDALSIYPKYQKFQNPTE